MSIKWKSGIFALTLLLAGCAGDGGSGANGTQAPAEQKVTAGAVMDLRSKTMLN